MSMSSYALLKHWNKKMKNSRQKWRRYNHIIYRIEKIKWVADDIWLNEKSANYQNYSTGTWKYRDMKKLEKTTWKYRVTELWNALKWTGYLLWCNELDNTCKEIDGDCRHIHWQVRTSAATVTFIYKCKFLMQIYLHLFINTCLHVRFQ